MASSALYCIFLFLSVFSVSTNRQQTHLKKSRVVEYSGNWEEQKCVVYQYHYPAAAVVRQYAITFKFTVSVSGSHTFPRRRGSHPPRVLPVHPGWQRLRAVLEEADLQGHRQTRRFHTRILQKPKISRAAGVEYRPYEQIIRWAWVRSFGPYFKHGSDHRLVSIWWI